MIYKVRKLAMALQLSVIRMCVLNKVVNTSNIPSKVIKTREVFIIESRFLDKLLIQTL
jgi:hypothetical protein